MKHKWGKWVAVVLCVLVVLALRGCGKEKIDGKLNPRDYAYEYNWKVIPDMGLFLGLRGEEAEEGSDSGGQTFYVNDEERDEALVLEYLELLTGPEFGFEIVAMQEFDPAAEGSPFVKGFANSYWAVGLASTKMDAGLTMSCIFGDEPCDLYIYGAKGNVSLRYSSVFDVADTGHRYSGYEGDTLTALTGERVLDAYYRKGKKYYNKGDGDLWVKTGKAEEFEFSSNSEDYIAYTGKAGVIVNDGKLVQAKAEIKPTSSTRYYIKVTEFLPKEMEEEITLYLPRNVESGQVFRYCDFLSGHQKENDKGNYMFSYDPNHAASSMAASYSRDIRGCVEELTVRVLNWDDTNKKDCLVYIHAKVIYEADPIEVECLLAAPANNPEYLELAEAEEESKSGGIFSIFSSDNDNKGYTKPDFAKLDCLTCGGDGDCNTCNGYGEVERYAGGGDTVTSKCSSCYGSGNCRRCGGTGHRE